jgi:hypothetical protein
MSCTLLHPVAPANSAICCQTLVKKNEKQKRKDTKLHKKLQVLKDKKYSQLLATNEKKYSKLVSDLHQNFNDQLHQSDEKVLAATEQYPYLKHYNTCLDDIRIKHCSRLWKQQILHAQIIELKNESIKKMWKDVEATGEMLREMFEEINSQNAQ